MNKIGRIFGEIIDNQFSFASKEFFEGHFVAVKKEDNDENSAELICEIINKKINNKFLASPEIIKYMNEKMDFMRDTIYEYSVSPIGVVKNNVIASEEINALPGKMVYTVDEEKLRCVYGFTDEGVEIGYLRRFSKCRIKLDVKRIFQPHLFVVGKTGSGKSYFVRKFMQALNEKYWIFSPSDEYNNLNENMVRQQKEFIMPLETDNISFYLGLNASEELIFRNISFDTTKVYTSKDIKNAIVDYYRNKQKKVENVQLSFNFGESKDDDVVLPAYANSLIQKMRSVRHLKFSKDSKKVAVPKDSAIFDMSDFSQLEQECIINYYLFKLRTSRKNTKSDDLKKHIVVIEEAHNYVPSMKSTLCKEILVRLAREGRKYGISLCFITQRPRYFDQTALSQSGNKIIFALPNPDDVKHVVEDVAYYRPDLPASIQGQKRGECIIVGDAYNDAIQIMIDR